MTVREFSFATPAELGRLAYLGVCERAGLEPVPDGYGLRLSVLDASASGICRRRPS